MMKVIGYARASTASQDNTIKTQLSNLAESFELISTFSDVGSGRSVNPGLLNALKLANDEGLPLAVTHADRLARAHSVLDLVEALGITVFTLYGPEGLRDAVEFAEAELTIIKKRQALGIAAAKRRGAYHGRKASIDPAVIQERLERGERPADIARSMGIARSSVYRLREAVSFAEEEVRLISERTRAGLRAAKARGVKLGNPNGAAPLRRASKGNSAAVAARKASVDGRCAELAGEIAAICAGGATSLREIAAGLNERRIEAPRGGSWHPSGIKRYLERIELLAEEAQ